MKHYLTLFFSLVLISVTSFGQETAAEVRAMLDSNQIKVGDQAHLTIQVTYQTGNNVIFPVLKDTLKGGISIVEIQDIDTAYDADDVKIKILSQEITITAWDSGFYPIEPFLFVVNGEEFKTQPLLLEVSDVRLNPDADIKDIKGVNETPFSFVEFLKSNWYYFVIGLILILLIIGLVWYLNNKTEEVQEMLKPKPSIPAHIEALKALDELAKKKLWQQDQVKTYYSELTHILRVYLERRFEIHALEQTSDEIILALRYTDIPDAEKKKVMHVLLLADMVKFAKEQPISSENEAAIADVKKVVELTKLSEITDKKEKEGEE